MPNIPISTPIPNEFGSSRANRVIGFLAAARFITMSLLIHLVIVIVGGSFVLFKVSASRPDFVAGGDGFLVATDSAPHTPQEELVLPDVKLEAASTPPSLASAMGAMTSTTAQATFAMPGTALNGAGKEGVARLNASTAGTIGLGTLGGRAGGSAMKMFGVQSRANSVVVCLDVSSIDRCESDCRS